jgi:cell division protein FtsB
MKINWDRFGRVALVIVLFAILVSYLNPVVNFVHAWRDSKTTKEHLAELRQENVDLQRQAADDSSDAVLVREARRLGMVRPGERAWTIKNLPH